MNGNDRTFSATSKLLSSCLLASASAWTLVCFWRKVYCVFVQLETYFKNTGMHYSFLIVLQIENEVTADYTPPPPLPGGEGKINKLIQINRSPETEFFILFLARTRCNRYNSSATRHSRDDHTISLQRAATAGTRCLQRATAATRRLLQPTSATRLQPPAGSVPRTTGGHGCKTLIYFPFV